MTTTTSSAPSAAPRFRKASKFKQQDVTRVAVICYGLQHDYTLPSSLTIGEITQAIVPLIQARRESLELDPAPLGAGEYGSKILTLSKLDGDPLPHDQNLGSLGIADGELLVLSAADVAVSVTQITENVSSAAAAINHKRSAAVEKADAVRAGCVALMAGAAVVAGLLVNAWRLQVSSHWTVLPGAVAGGLAVALLAAAVIVRMNGSRLVSGAAGAAGLILTAAAAYMLVPGAGGAANLLLAAVFTAVFAGLLGFSGVLSRLPVAVALIAGFGLAAIALMRLIFQTPAAYLSVGVLIAGLLAVELAPVAAWLFAPFPSPEFPSVTGDFAFESADDLANEALVAAETHGTPTLGELVNSASIANTNLTAVVGTATAFVTCATIWLTWPGDAWWWLKLILAGVVAAVLLLGGRRFRDRTQALLIMAGGLAVIAGVGVRYALASPYPWFSAAIAAALLGVGALAVILASTVPDVTFPTLALRAVEIVEYVLLAAIIPISVCILNLVHYARFH
ncbi:type VII secretion integral membrane protein EccD [Mycobacteroides abscessus]|uniref:type VII secretion integral membrane protein EccD n=1 Tax=Mycobacteroides abscessus TaxID=36809 RepID=UPI0009A665E5|nr:type VII secretion integral membrane protein EccD [Mycobacteroides abscessus]SKO15928.1 secretion protein Snm4 [Mycobacteroides abscessus subsp. bolletii]SKX37153.1 secretion protein Snm4 [Mycobacteroides abscessus subsp. bolletii]